MEQSLEVVSGYAVEPETLLVLLDDLLLHDVDEDGLLSALLPTICPVVMLPDRVGLLREACFPEFRGARGGDHHSWATRHLIRKNAFVTALRSSASSVGADAWLTWASAFADRLARDASALSMPPDPTITHEALAPFMAPWSTYGPYPARLF
ncbi:hypothetical protein [Rathayibacter sp. AY1E4]|uniref:hypothetical protein n=1 Tax=Rathayibacter sp. AY1E4 TaxID=2080552 RepID=UPI0011B0878D|nr:hypothetical protein [Rathayibacter sp. AY1E4]